MVDDIYFNPHDDNNTNGPDNWSHVDALDPPFGTAGAPGRGASGSPVFYGGTTYGMLTHSDLTFHASWAYMRSQSVHNVLEFAISGVNSVDFVCWQSSLCDPS